MFDLFPLPFLIADGRTDRLTASAGQLSPSVSAPQVSQARTFRQSCDVAGQGPDAREHLTDEL